MRKTFFSVAFVLLSALAVATSSEHIFSYTGAPVYDTALTYAFPVAAGLWAIERFNVRRVAPLFLVGALIGFLVEGVLVPLIYGHPLFISWTPLAWHAPLSFMLLWYYFRKWCVAGSWVKLIIASAALGIFWGTWATANWVPAELVAEEDEDFVQVIKTSTEFTTFAFAHGGLLLLAHAGIGFVWPKRFDPGPIFMGLVGTFLLGYFVLNILVISLIFWAPIQLGLLLYLLLFAFRKNDETEIEKSVFVELAGHATIPSLMAILTLPLVASATYWYMSVVEPSADTIYENIYVGYPVLMMFAGIWLFVWAYWRTLSPGKSRQAVPVGT